MKLETFESYQSSMMGFGHNRISESVGALTPVSL